MAKKNDEAAASKKVDYGVDAETFIKCWETACATGKTAQWVSEQLGVPKPIVLARAHYYRKNLINLSKIPRKAESQLDIAGLNKLIGQLRRPGMAQFESHVPPAEAAAPIKKKA